MEYEKELYTIDHRTYGGMIYEADFDTTNPLSPGSNITRIITANNWDIYCKKLSTIGGYKFGAVMNI